MSSEPVTLMAADGWELRGDVFYPEGTPRAGVVLVHGSKHERDAYGVGLPQFLTDGGVAVVQVDIRGRGDSREPVAFPALAPLQRRQVALDVAAASAHVASLGPSDAGLAVVSEQDSTSAALTAVLDRPVAAHVFVSGRLTAPAREALRSLDAPRFCLVSNEDRRALRDMTDAYLAGEDARSRFRIFQGLGFGTTMFSSWQFAHPDEPSIESLIADWLLEVL